MATVDSTAALYDLDAGARIRSLLEEPLSLAL